MSCRTGRGEQKSYNSDRVLGHKDESDLDVCFVRYGAVAHSLVVNPAGGDWAIRTVGIWVKYRLDATDKAAPRCSLRNVHLQATALKSTRLLEGSSRLQEESCSDRWYGILRRQVASTGTRNQLVGVNGLNGRSPRFDGDLEVPANSCRLDFRLQ